MLVIVLTDKIDYSGISLQCIVFVKWLIMLILIYSYRHILEKNELSFRQ